MIDGVDTAFPHDTYPVGARIVCGYAGGHTAHTWTVAEVEAVRATGRKWLAIWTALNQSGVLTAQLGGQDAAAMAAKLPDYQYLKTDPVFYDVENAIYDRDPGGAEAAITAWKAGMRARGYTRPYVYTVKRQGGDWIADWTGARPTSIPPGKIGVQWLGDSGGFDFNVFDDSLLGDPMSTPLTAADVWNEIIGATAARQWIVDIKTELDFIRAQNVNVQNKIDAQGAQTDYGKLAAALIAAGLPQQLASHLALTSK